MKIQVIETSLKSYRNAIGIHLKNPTPYKIECALETAERDLFPAVYCHYSPTFKKYLDVIRKGTFTKSDIDGFRKALGFCSSLDAEDKQALLNEFEGRHYKITKQQSDFGIAYLRKVSFKLDGTPRATKSLPFGEFELNVIRNFKLFKFVGLEAQTNGLGEVMSYLPIYRCQARNGDAFDYVAGMWGNMAVVNRVRG